MSFSDVFCICTGYSYGSDMGIPFGYPILVYLARPNMEKTQYEEDPTRQPEEVVD
jgi:hypothetical protein